MGFQFNYPLMKKNLLFVTTKCIIMYYAIPSMPKKICYFDGDREKACSGSLVMIVKCYWILAGEWLLKVGLLWLFQKPFGTSLRSTISSKLFENSHQAAENLFNAYVHTICISRFYLPSSIFCLQCIKYISIDILH